MASQATVGLLVAKTLTNATANPFLAGGAGAYNPVLALDVFLVQASTNTLLSHFASLLCSLYIMRVISQNPPVPPESLGAVPARA
ncbi:g10768 [Coccomyxa elongata]